MASGPMSLGRRDGLLAGRPCCMLRCSRKSVSQLKHLQGPQHSHTDCYAYSAMREFNYATGSLAVLNGHSFIAEVNLE